jgi:hypothetical protein
MARVAAALGCTEGQTYTAVIGVVLGLGLAVLGVPAAMRHKAMLPGEAAGALVGPGAPSGALVANDGGGVATPPTTAELAGMFGTGPAVASAAVWSPAPVGVTAGASPYSGGPPAQPSSPPAGPKGPTGNPGCALDAGLPTPVFGPTVGALRTTQTTLAAAAGQPAPLDPASTINDTAGCEPGVSP